MRIGVATIGVEKGPILDTKGPILDLDARKMGREVETDPILERRAVNLEIRIKRRRRRGNPAGKVNHDPLLDLEVRILDQILDQIQIQAMLHILGMFYVIFKAYSNSAFFDKDTPQ